MFNSSIDKYGFSNQVVEVVKPIIEELNRNNIEAFEQKIAKLAVDVCKTIENGTLNKKEGDNYFSLIDMYIDDNHPTIELKEEIKNILFEGMILHDYNKDYGANLSTIRELAKKILI